MQAGCGVPPPARPRRGRARGLRPGARARPLGRGAAVPRAKAGGTRTLTGVGSLSVAGSSDSSHLRLAELVAALSLGIDLGFGQPMEHVLRQCLIALRLADRIGLDEPQRASVYYTALLINVGCHSDAHEQAKWFGDDIALKSQKYDHEYPSVRGAVATMRRVGSGNPPLHRFRVGLEFVLSGRRDLDGMVAHHARMARLLAEQLGLTDDVGQALGAAYEQWDGRGWPGECKGADVPLAARLAQLAAVAGAQLGLTEADVRTLRRAGLAHDLGRLGISNSIWDKAGPLGPGEWERVRMHPYLTERMLNQSEALAPLAAIAVQHRERLDGSGYPRGLAGGAVSRPARILGAADAYQAMREPRPYRPARSADEAAAELRADARAGLLDADAVEAVLGAAGHRVLHRREGPAGLTPREVEVLRLVARGLSNKQIAQRLVISPKTVGNHVEHIYAKIDVRTRAGAGLFAMQHGLLPKETFPAVAPVA